MIREQESDKTGTASADAIDKFARNVIAMQNREGDNRAAKMRSRAVAPNVNGG